MKSKNIRKWYIATVIIIVLIAVDLVLEWVRLGHSPFEFRASSISLPEFGFCNGISPATDEPEWTDEEIFQGSDEIQLCGFLDSETRTNLGVYVYFLEDEARYLYDSTEPLGAGYFSYDFFLPVEAPTGMYRLDITQGRRILGSINFQIESD